MAYTELLNQIIEESRLTANEICRRCQADGINLQSTYLSQLRNDPTRRAKDYISRAIAKVCGKPEDWLVTQSRLDRDTETLKKMHANLRDSTVLSIKMLLKASGHSELCDIAEQIMNEMLEIEFMSEAASADMAFVNTVFDEAFTDSTFTKLLKRLNLIAFPVQDDAMSPKITKGGKVVLEKCEYKDSDILCYQKTEGEVYYIRQARFLDDSKTEVMMVPYNGNYQAEVLKTGDLFIYGKVKQLIVELE